MIKCFVQGAQSVGKSTLLSQIVGEKIDGRAITVVEDIARTLSKKGVTYDVNTSTDDFFAYYYTHLYNLRTINNDIVLFDRSIIDVITYAKIIYGKNSWIELMGKEIFNAVKDSIDMVLYIPIEFQIEADDMRNTDPKNQYGYDCCLKETMNELGLTYRLISGSREQRKEALSAYLRSTL